MSSKKTAGTFSRYNAEGDVEPALAFRQSDRGLGRHGTL